ncbi:hypothetical protein BDF21DRAFT_405151 [Thamnidium elegans]|nr:hypothetical protein BDF21DRAFT_405162 [Thamnidium elegans]KAI8047279.1 hypothetical protein BDF21DRAFT_405151 [Thamnidium elegans]
MYSPLADTQEPIDDVKELSFTPLSEPLTVNIDDIDLDGERAYGEGIVSRGQLREFYGPGKRASAKRKVEILGYKFRSHLFTQERKEMKYGKKHMVMFIGDRGTGAGSTIKGYRRYGGTWKQRSHGKSNTTCITNENKATQTCVYYLYPLYRTNQKVMMKRKMVQKTCVFVRHRFIRSGYTIIQPNVSPIRSNTHFEIISEKKISNQVKICLLRFQYLQISWWRKGKDLVTLAEPMTLPRF